jgi:nickel/cobalt transporter (NicO) family protein
MLGFVHGLGIDHLMAIAALSVDGRSAGSHSHRIVRTAVQFAAGHAAMLGLGAIAAVLLGWTLPAAFAAGAERLGGGLLIVLGLAGVWTLMAGRAYGHVHTEQDGRTRWHFHVGRNGGHRGTHSHSTIPAAMGAVFAVSSLRALVLLAPLTPAGGALSLPVLLILVLLFGLGVLLSMSLFGVFLARVWSINAVEALGRTAGLTVAVASIALGAYWMIA